MSGRWTVSAGRNVYFDGKPFISVDREGDTEPVEADGSVHFIVDCLNHAGVTPDDIWERHMGHPRHRPKHAHEERRRLNPAAARPTMRDDGASQNIYWRDIPPGSSVELVGQRGARSYVAVLPDGRRMRVYWSGHDSVVAQRTLDSMVEHGKRLPAPRPRMRGR